MKINYIMYIHCLYITNSAIMIFVCLKQKLRPAPKKGRDAVFFRTELSAASLMCKEEHCYKQGGYDPCADFYLLYFAAECFDYYI